MKWEKSNYMETKKHTTKYQYINDDNSQFKNILRQMTMISQPYKLYETQQNQFLEGRS